MRPQYTRQAGPNVVDIERVEMAQNLLETSTEMQLHGLKRILGDKIKNPLIIREARVIAEHAYTLACYLQEHTEFLITERRKWIRLKGLTPSLDSTEYAIDDEGRKVRFPEYMVIEFNELTAMQMQLDLEISQVGMTSGAQIYKDIIAQTSPKRSMGGAFRDAAAGDEPQDEQGAD